VSLKVYKSGAEAKRQLQDLLGRSDEACKRALLVVFANQTATEQQCEGTFEDNGIGFTGVDGHILSSFAKQLNRFGKLSEKQMVILRKKMPRYWRQLWREAQRKFMLKEAIRRIEKLEELPPEMVDFLMGQPAGDIMLKQYYIDRARAEGLDP
jgi:hypothetical protein